MVRLHILMVAGLAGQRWRLYSLELSIWRVARCVPPSHAIYRGWNRGAARLAFDRLDCASVAGKRGHLEIQKGPLGVKWGQYPSVDLEGLKKLRTMLEKYQGILEMMRPEADDKDGEAAN